MGSPSSQPDAPGHRLPTLLLPPWRQTGRTSSSSEQLRGPASETGGPISYERDQPGQDPSRPEAEQRRQMSMDVPVLRPALDHDSTRSESEAFRRLPSVQLRSR